MEEDIYQDYELNPRISKKKPDKKDIYKELKSDFKKNRTNKKHNYLIYILAIVLIVCTYLFIHGNNKIHETSKPLDYIQLDWEIVELSDVKIIKIPQKIYDSIEENSNVSQEMYNQLSRYGDVISLDEYLSGDKKRVLLVTRDGCPYARKFHNAINKAFTEYDVSSQYSKDIKTTWKSFSFPCFYGEVCASDWLFNICWEWFCIINPITKEIIADTSQNTKQVLPLLRAYKLRYSEPLLK